MSLRNKFFSAVTLGAAVFAFSAIGMAQETAATTTDKTEKVKGEHRGHGKRGFGRGDFGGKRGHHRGMGGKMGFFRFIELTEAQKVQFKAIHEANKPSQELREEMMTLRAAKRAGTITADQQARIDTLKAQAKEKHASIKSQIDAILTAEQKEQIEKRKVEMKQRMEERQKLRQERKAAKQAETTTTDKPKDN